MDGILKDLVSGPGCAVDGSATARNPLASTVQHMMENVAMPGVGGRGGSAAGPQVYAMRGGMDHPDLWEGRPGEGAMRPPPPPAPGMSMDARSAWGASMPAPGATPAAAAAAWQHATPSTAGMAIAGAGGGGGSGAPSEAVMMGRPAGFAYGHPMGAGPMGMGPMGIGGMGVGGMGMMGMGGHGPHGGMMMGQYGGGQMYAGSRWHVPAPVAAPAPPAATQATSAPAETTTADTAPEASSAPAEAAPPQEIPAPTEDDSARIRQASASIVEALRSHPDPRFHSSEFVDLMTRMGEGELVVDQDTIKSSGKTASGPLMTGAPVESSGAEEAKQAAAIEAAFGSISAEDIQSRMAAIWEASMAESRSTSYSSASGTYSVPSGEPNEFLEMDDAFEQGCQLFNEGRIVDAVRAFHAVVSRQPEHSEAWRMLGMCHMESDADKPAIVCLEQAVEQDPYNLEALVALGVSYVNILNHSKALSTLKSWVKHHPKFHGLEVDADPYSDGTLLDDVMQLMLKAAAWDSADPQVHVVLGVLYNVSKDYESAVAHFKTATEMMPDDYSLWNKLGASLANNERSAEALPCYERAIQLKPNHSRCWLNVGISQANVGNYLESARAYVRALQLSPTATHIWGYLRIVLTCLERFDLARETHKRDVDLLLRELGKPSFPSV